MNAYSHLSIEQLKEWRESLKVKMDINRRTLEAEGRPQLDYEFAKKSNEALSNDLASVEEAIKLRGEK